MTAERAMDDFHGWVENAGASADEIRRHYDVGNEFYRLWLDEGMNYSCALWVEGQQDDRLEEAQLRKLSYHVESANARGRNAVLDVGCGWGALLQSYRIVLERPRTVFRQ